jgi:hypothetical protein
MVVGAPCTVLHTLADIDLLSIKAAGSAKDAVKDATVIIQTPHKPWNTPRTSIM